MRSGLLFVACLTASLAGCDGCGRHARRDAGARDSGAGGDGVPFVLAWTVRSEHWGTEALMVKRDGHARWMLDAPGADGAHLRSELTLSPEELDALGHLFADNHVCDLRSLRAAKENESRPTLDVDFPGARCTVSMWFDEWRETPAALPASGAIANLRERLRQEALH